MRTIGLLSFKNFITIYIIISFFYFNSLSAQTNHLEGIDFWFGYMGNLTPAHSVIAITSQGPVLGIVEIPLSNYTDTFELTGPGSVEIELPVGLTQTHNTGLFPSGVHLISNNPITVTLMNRTGASDDASLVKPSESLGYEYMITSFAENDPETFIIVSTRDNTEIEITYPDGIKDSFKMDEGELYQKNDNSNFTGTIIESICNSKGEKNPIAVFSGSVYTAMWKAHRDHIVSQMQPTTSWGKSFNLFPFPYNDEYLLTILAKEDNTQVQVSSKNSFTRVLNRGKYYRGDISGYGYVFADKPISVSIVTPGADYNTTTNYDGDPFLVNISPDDQGIDEFRFYSFQVFTSNYPNLQKIHVVTDSSNVGNVRLNGNIIGLNLNPYNSKYVIGDVTLPHGNGDYLLTSSGSSFTAYPSAQLHARSYAYCIGHNTSFDKKTFEIGYLADTLEQSEFTDTICSCENVWFGVVDKDSDGIAYWDFGDGKNDTGKTVLHQYSLNGNYEVKLSILDSNGCRTPVKDKTNLIVQNCDILKSPNSIICPGDSVELSSVKGTTFLWNTGQKVRSIVVSPEKTTIYSLQVDGGNTSICDSILVEVRELKIDYQDSVHYCIDENFNISIGAQGKYLWSTGDTTRKIKVNDGGKYWFIYEDFYGCEYSDTIELFISEPPIWKLNKVGNPCLFNSIRLEPDLTYNSQYDYLWSTNDTTSNIIIIESSLYTLQIDDGVCLSSDSLFIDMDCFTFHIPNSFTPNDDGINDFFYGTGKGISHFKMTIYNRWGDVIFETADFLQPWNGKNNEGKESPQGTYIYDIEIRDYKGQSHMFKSSFTLFR